ncbi:hypothetical protein J5500_00600, partial [Candidatus Saccharibacteria bacterium]|nr:hypothetical protein [Candidatus Saccharibacteria bacterium]
MKRGNLKIMTSVLLMVVCFCSVILSANTALADDDTVVDQINVTVAESCTLAGVGMDSHVATLHNDEYSGHSGSSYVNGIGKTTLTAFCNDYNGFSIYAIGFTG